MTTDHSKPAAETQDGITLSNHCYIASIAQGTEHFYMFHLSQPLTMPCGAEVRMTGHDQPCPNSGNCSAGVRKYCWVEKYADRDPALEINYGPR